MSVGAQLRASREAKGLSIDAVAHLTRVQPRILAAIEQDDLRAVPPRPFGRGFVRSYAREIGLDPDRTARDYFAQFAVEAPVVVRPPQPATPPRLSAWVVVGLGVSAGLAAAFLLGRTPAPPPPNAADTVGPPGAAAAAPVAPAAAAPPPQIAQPSAPPPPLSIVLTATRPSWVTASADGRRVLYETIVPGAPRTITAAGGIVIRVGDAGALQWQINGRHAGAMGQPGQVREIRITPESAPTIR